MSNIKMPFELPLTDGSIQLDAMTDADLPLLDGFFRRPQDLYYYVPTLVFPRTAAQLRKMMSDWSDNLRYFSFAIRNNGQLAGLIHIDDLDLVNGHAEIGIALTDPDARGQGLAARSIKVMLRYVFLELGLHRLTARIIDGNEPSIKLFTGLGFVQEGLLRQYVLRGGNHLDMHVFGLLRPEWQSLFPSLDRDGHSTGQDLG